MTDREAIGWGIGGLILTVGGLELLRRTDQFLFELWGMGLLIIGGVLCVVGLGVVAPALAVRD